MMENKEIELVKILHQNIRTLTNDLSIVIDNLSQLSNLIYDREINKLDEEIKLISHM